MRRPHVRTEQAQDEDVGNAHDDLGTEKAEDRYEEHAARARVRPSHFVSHPSSSSASSATKRKSLSNLHLHPDSTFRSTRLSQAREELDDALQDALGYSDGVHNAEEGGDQGENTVSMNEDFTMISVETLKSMREGESLLSLRGEEKEVSFMDSSPPKQMLYSSGVGEKEGEGVTYPTLPPSVEQSTGQIATYDAMSWQPTGPARTVQAGPTTKDVDARLGAQQQTDHHENNADDDAADDDIWAEEASRELEDEAPPQPRQSQQQRAQDRGAEAPNALSGPRDEVPRPPRGKIPRTWRRKSGADFLYSDSPAREGIAGVEEGQGSRGSRGSKGSGGSGGVLTPPSSGEEEREEAEETGQEVDETQRHDCNDDDDDGNGNADLDFTLPDAAATGLHQSSPAAIHHRQASVTIAPPPSNSLASHGSSTLEDDTGIFWRRKASRGEQRKPARELGSRRLRLGPQKKRAMDLSELLGLEKSSPAKADIGGSGSVRRDGEVKGLKTGLLRSSKGLGSPGGGKTGSQSAATSRPVARGGEENDEVDSSEEDVGESFESKASDQRQLLAENYARRRSSHLQYAARPRHENEENEGDQRDSASYQQQSEEEGEEEEDGEEAEGEVLTPLQHDQDPSTFRSYEEHLNLDSPTKVRVNFDSPLSSYEEDIREEEKNEEESQERQEESTNPSSLLAPRKAYAPLFASSKPLRTTRRSAPEALTKPPTNPPNLIMRLSNILWSTLIRPTGSPEVLPPTQTPYPTCLRARLRTRYGVLPSTHPWTLAHMRTLHRMLNSSLTKPDTLIPSPSNNRNNKTQILPAHLAELVGKPQISTTGFPYVFSAQHACVLAAFAQILVDRGVVEAMERGEVEGLGDNMAGVLRGLYGGRDGVERVWEAGVGEGRGMLGWGFLIGALGDCVREVE